jgi:hypothetical protein
VKQFVLAYTIVVVMSAADSSLAADLQLRVDVAQKRLGASITKKPLGTARSGYAQGSTRNASPDFGLASKLSISLPDSHLLERQPAPDCQFESAAKVDDDVVLRTIMKLDYEQQCYRQSESILRTRMEQLQDAVFKTIESLK